jgi:hypothetical protein
LSDEDADDQVEEPAGEGSQNQPSESMLGGVALALLLLAGLAVGVVWLISSLAPDDIPSRPDPDFIDTIFASPIVVAASRLVLLSASVVLLVAGLYIVVSVIVRMSRGHWLRRAGPFESEIAEEVAEGLDEADDIVESWMQTLSENERLAERLEEADEAIRALLDERDQLIEELTRREGT